MYFQVVAELGNSMAPPATHEAFHVQNESTPARRSSRSQRESSTGELRPQKWRLTCIHFLGNAVETHSKTRSSPERVPGSRDLEAYHSMSCVP